MRAESRETNLRKTVGRMGEDEGGVGWGERQRERGLRGELEREGERGARRREREGETGGREQTHTERRDGGGEGGGYNILVLYQLSNQST